MPLPSADLPVTGLQAPAEILTDPWGIPHIYASSTHDAFWAQGFQVARDRLWQIDTWRRRGLGLLAQVWGAEYAEQDRAARLFLFRGDMHAEWLAYASDTKDIATAFTAGINAYVTQVREDPSRVPLEFRELGYEPAFWAPSDVVRIRSHGLFHNVTQEVARALMLREFGPAAEELRRRREPGGELTVPDGLDLSVIPEDVLRDYMLAVSPAQLRAPAGDAAEAGGGPVQAGEGSNNWALAPERTAAGRALLANDPHRTASLPRGGSSDTVAATTYLADFTQTAGATFRLVVDVGGWDNSVVMNSPGQSGDPASPHYADLLALWAADGAVPLLYSRDRIEAVTEERIRLVPREAHGRPQADSR